MLSEPAGANRDPVEAGANEGARLLEALPGAKERPDPEWATG